jgi:hypothetical protein
MRTLLRKLILWALAGAPAVQHDPSELDNYAAENREG